MSIRDYKKYLDSKKRDFEKELLQGRASVINLAIYRYTIEKMEAQLKKDPSRVTGHDVFATSTRSGPDVWYFKLCTEALQRYYPEGDVYKKKHIEYWLFGKQCMLNVGLWKSTFEDRKKGIRYVQTAGVKLKKLIAAILKELVRWSYLRRGEDWYLTASPKDGLIRMLSERPDIVAVLRIAQTLSIDTTKSGIPIVRKPHEEFIELLVGFIPVVGNIVCAYEAYTGRDLFDYHLSNIERSILGGAMLLPVAGRLVRGGKSLYTAQRMKRLYGL